MVPFEIKVNFDKQVVTFGIKVIFDKQEWVLQPPPSSPHFNPIWHLVMNSGDSKWYLLRGVQGLKVWQHDFEITSDPKGPQRGPSQ